jgi:D-psicose/D-tagatose/L-ribulose 3-epimerase
MSPTMTPGRLGVSNLAWSAAHEERAMDMLVECGAHGVEVAPTRLAPWPEITAERLAGFRRSCEARGLAVSSLQAIFYEVPEAALLAEPARFDAMAEQVRRVGGIAEALGATVAVFGAPRSRARGDMPVDAAMALAADRLAVLGDIAAQFGLRLGMEAVPPYYGADFLIHPLEVVALVERCGHPNIRAHVDIACSTLGGCDPVIAVRASSPVHYHIAEPDLVPLRTPVCDHAGVAQALTALDYAGWMVIEMREDKVDDLAAIRDSVAFARRTYSVRPAIGG